MRQTSCRQPRKALARMFTGQLPGAEQDRLLAHIRCCPDCKERYLQHLSVERAAVHGECVTPTHFERERLGQRIFARAEAMEGFMQGSEPERHDARRRLTLLAAAAVVILVLPGAALVWNHLRGTQLDLTPKGGAVRTPVGMRVLRMYGHDGRQVIRDPISDPSCDGRLRINDMLLMLYSNPGTERHAFVVGVSSDWEPRWYYPAPPERMSTRLQGYTSSQPLGDPVVLRVNHDPGPLVIFALLSQEPLSSIQIARSLRRAKKEGRSPWQRARLPLPGKTTQVRLRLIIEP